MKIILTGSCGFVGKHLKKKLTNLNYKVIELDIVSGIDITNFEQITNIGQFDVLIHLAAKTYVPDSYVHSRQFYFVNTVGTINMLELCKIHNAKIIFISSYVYGIPDYIPIDEEHSVSALNPYAQSKIIGEELCKGYHRDFDIPVIIFRPFNIYGKGQNENFLIPKIIKQINETPKVKLRDPRPKRDFIYIDDVVNAYCKAIEYNKSNFEVFNIGSGISCSVKEIAETLISLSSKNIPLEFSGEERNNEVLDTVADISKIKYKLNWQPEVSIKEGLHNIIMN
jgi:UDP-glucose 4-epimerase